eukprot:7151593-Pyramimonas_sp.AAC.1
MVRPPPTPSREAPSTRRGHSKTILFTRFRALLTPPGIQDPGTVRGKRHKAKSGVNLAGARRSGGVYDGPSAMRRKGMRKQRGATRERGRGGGTLSF